MAASAAAALLALASLAGCSAPPAHVTVTVAAPEPTPAPSDAPTGGSTDPANPTNPANPVPDDGSPSIVVTQGPIAPECTHSVCHVVHVTWTNFDPGPHDTQCVTDHGDIATWSQSTYNFPTADGERDLGCFLGYPGSHVWVVIDGTLESEHADWP